MNKTTPIEAEILRLTEARGPDRSICPTEVARALSPGEGDAWRSLLSAVRRAAAGLASQQRIDILRKGKRIDPAEMKGVIRLRLRPPGVRPPGESGPGAGDAAAEPDPA